MAAGHPTTSEADEEACIKPGTVIDSGKANYIVDYMLGEGGFGAVYKVHDAKDENKAYAMKVEKKLETRQHSKLKMEIALLKEVFDYVEDSKQPEDVRNRAQKHFTAMIDRGKKADFFYLVMDLVGSSLSDLKQKSPGRHLSLSCGISASKQCLESVQILHVLGYIHRDLKPANFAVGREPKQHTVYILDFGIARRVVKDNKIMKTPRSRVGFKGTVRYASVACHKNVEVYYRDDCESWFYMLIDLVSPDGLPWQRMSDKLDVGRCKEMIRAPGPVQDMMMAAAGSCSHELLQILDYIVGAPGTHKPDYNYIYKLLLEAIQKSGAVDFDHPHDWELKPQPKHSRRREREHKREPKSPILDLIPVARKSDAGEHDRESDDESDPQKEMPLPPRRSNRR